MQSALTMGSSELPTGTGLGVTIRTSAGGISDEVASKGALRRGSSRDVDDDDYF